MKALFTLIFVFFIASSAQSQCPKNDLKEETIIMEVVIASEKMEFSLDKEQDVARLYMDKNYRVKKALAFTTKRNKAKLV
ncbi:hypothetical protein SAMN04487911_102138 [Arenibacter nanhaiticus]|uniref:Uncharacterized protein n=1 Tax=Arenibacter nanhaiticus TaxID=558155 RepID=A0A1M6BBV3_9FLAO|nr:hypothetical protein [Arenibacter nanhaiticus]SHI46244.1 hypothetical protein SAMN04487911_102138 [Arenibacter nanhaiticus]